MAFGRSRRGVRFTVRSVANVTTLDPDFENVEGAADDVEDPASDAEPLTLAFFGFTPFSAMVSMMILVLSSFRNACFRGMSCPNFDTVDHRHLPTLPSLVRHFGLAMGLYRRKCAASHCRCQPG